VRSVQIGKGWFPEESGGLNRYYHDLVRQLPLVGIDVTGLVVGSEQVETGSGGAVRSFAPRHATLAERLARARVQARRAVAAESSSVIAAHFALYAVSCLDLIPAGRFVVHFHGPWADESRIEGSGTLAVMVKQRIERLVYRRAARLIVLSRAFGEVLEKRYRVPPERIRVIPGGVDTRRFASSLSRVEARLALGWPTDRPIALVVRRLVRRMGLEDLIASVRLARVQVPELLVLIAGAGPLAAELEARTADANAGNHVRLLGFVPDDRLPLAYRAADLSIVPSVALEGFGLVVAESLAAGTPALVTAVGGLPETVDGLSPDCVVQEPGPNPLASRIAGALRGCFDLPTRDTCVRHARERFDWGVVGKKVRAVYEELQ